MRKFVQTIVFSMFFAASIVSVAAISTSVAEANGDLLAKCHWYKQQAFNLKTDAAWKKYYDCMRGKF